MKNPNILNSVILEIEDPDGFPAGDRQMASKGCRMIPAVI